METENKNKPGKRFLSTWSRRYWFGINVSGRSQYRFTARRFRTKRFQSLRKQFPIMYNKQALKIHRHFPIWSNNHPARLSGL